VKRKSIFRVAATVLIVLLFAAVSARSQEKELRKCAVRHNLLVARGNC